MPEYGYCKAGALSPRVAVADPAENARRSLQAVKTALQAGVQIIVLPELGLAGCTCGDLFFQKTLLDACEAALLWLAQQTKYSDALLAAGLPVRMGGRLYNCAAVLQSGAILGFVPKQQLTQAEMRHFSVYTGEGCELSFGGSRVPFGCRLFSAGNALVGVEFGDEAAAPLPPAAQMALQGADLILCPAAHGEVVGTQEARRAMLAQQSARLHCGYACACAGAGESSTDQVFAGVCLIAENGSVLSETRRFEPEVAAVYACVDLELLQAERRTKLVHTPLQPLLPVACASPLPALKAAHITRKYHPAPFVPQTPRRLAARCREILDMQAAGLARRLEHTGLQQMILGLSGGLDSTLALLAAIRTAERLQRPRESILCVTMPGFGTSSATRSTAQALAEAAGVTLWEIDIRPACALHMQDIGHNPEEYDTTYENLQARERTQILMDLANQEQALLVGSGDLSELALGWSTYNADHMSMYNPVGGVPKTLVRHVVAYGLEELGEASLGRRIAETPISPELLPPDAQGNIAQRTEDILGSYLVHDFYLYYFYRFGFSPEKLFFMAGKAFAGQYAPAQLKQWLLVFLRRFFSQQFKRSCLPDGPAIGSVSLSPRGSWQMPSDSSAKAWIAQAEALEI